MSRTAALDLTLIVGIAACTAIAILGVVCTACGTLAVFGLGLAVIAIATVTPIAIAWTVALVADRT